MQADANDDAAAADGGPLAAAADGRWPELLQLSFPRIAAADLPPPLPADAEGRAKRPPLRVNENLLMWYADHLGAIVPWRATVSYCDEDGRAFCVFHGESEHHGLWIDERDDWVRLPAEATDAAPPVSSASSVAVRPFKLFWPGCAPHMINARHTSR